MKRSFLLIFLITLVGIIYIARLFQLQIIRGSEQDINQSATIKIEYDYPERGYIYDRNGKLLVANQLSYDVMVIPKEVKPLDTLEFCSLLKIDKENFIKHLVKKFNLPTENLQWKNHIDTTSKSSENTEIDEEWWWDSENYKIKKELK